MSAHTKGPWITERSDTGQVVRTPQGIQIADCRKMWEYRLTDEEANSNACLIAAAPELLRLLKEVAQCDEAHDDLFYDDPIFRKEIEQAIAKAEGLTDRRQE
jgi:hypothetical protein